MLCQASNVIHRPGECGSHNHSAGLAVDKPLLYTADWVPFRFTPNMQTFLGPIFTESLLPSGLMALGRALTQPEVGRRILHYARDSLTHFSLSLNSSSVYLPEMKSRLGCTGGGSLSTQLNRTSMQTLLRS
jgi:hypothetical protein